MSNRRRTIGTAGTKAALARVNDSALDALHEGDQIVARCYADATLWQLGPALCITPPIPTHASQHTIEWLERRVRADLLGRCGRCGAVLSATDDQRAEVRHGPGCELAEVPEELRGGSW